MRIFNKMKKTMLVLAASLFVVNVAFADTAILSHTTMGANGVAGEKANAITGVAGSVAEGFTATCANAGKTLDPATALTIDGTEYRTIKASNGAQTIVTLPEGKVATKLTLYSYTNKDAATTRTPYWKEICGVEYTKEELGADTLKCFKDYANPDVRTYTLDNVSTVTFTNTGEQQCFVALVEYEDAPAEPELPAVDSLKAGEVNILEVGKTYVLGEQYTRYSISYTAEADGFLTITPSVKLNLASTKINGVSTTLTKDSNGGFKKGIAKGSVFTAQYSVYSVPSEENPCNFTVTFEEGVPYEALSLTLASPADGGEWSGAAQYKSYGTKGVPHYEFSTLISTDVKASVKIGEKVYENIKLTVDGYNPSLDITALPDTLNKAIAAGLIKAGETFTLTLSNIVDKEFAANTLADQTFTYTLASTACTGVSPTVSTSRTTMVTDVTFSFDGNVALADTAKFYMVNLANNEVTELTGEVVEGTSVKVTVPAVEGLLPRLYNIVATGVTTAEGDKVITYGNEPGKLVASYGTGNGFFKGTTSLQNWGQVYSLKGFTATYPGEVIAVEGIATKPISFVKVDETTGAEEEMADVTLGYTINGNVIEFALSKAITEVGTYRFSVPQKHFWAKETYIEEDAKLSAPKYAYYQASITLTIDVVEPTATDVTDKLVNPTVDENMDGWTSNTNAQNKALATNKVEGVVFTGKFLENWVHQSSPLTGDISQTVSELPAGTYKVTMGAFSELQPNGGGSKVWAYANDSLSLEVNSATPAVYDVYVELQEGETLTLGLKVDGGANWIGFDNVKLAYYGDGSTVGMALKADWKVLLAAVEELKASYAAPVQVEALDAAVAAAKIGTTQEYLASAKAVNEAMAAFKKVNDAEVAYQTLAATLAGATAENPVDATAFIKNASFEDGQSWLQSGTDGGAINQPNEWKLSVKQEGWGDMCMNETAPQDGKYMFNAWSGTVHSVDLNQAVRLPGGSYTMTAAMRTEWTNQVTNQHLYAVIGTDTVHSDTLKVVDIMRPAGDTQGTNEAAWKTVEGWQTLTAKLTLAEETVVTIGVLSTGGTNDNAGWFQLDNFKLSCTGWVDPALAPAVDSLNALVVETEAYQKTLDLTNEMQASMNESLTQSITAAKAAAEAQESVAAVREAYNQLNMMYVQIVANIAGMEAQAAQTMMGEYENPTDEAGLANAINKVYEIVSNMMSNPESTYTVADLNAAVEAMRTAKAAFVKENTPAITEVSVSLTHTASSYSGGTAGDFTSTVDAEKEHINNSKFSGTWAGAAYAEFSVLLPEGVSVKSATLAWSGVGSNKNRTTDIMYVGAGETIDYATMQSTGKESVNLSATKIATVTFTANTTTDFTTDVTDAVKTIVEGGQNYIIFKFTNNVGGGDLVGKGAAEKAPVLTLETVDASAMTTYTVKYVDGEGNEVKAAGVYDIVTGETATVSDEDKAAIYTEDNAKKYIYVSSDKESIVTVADSASNVITATFREAATYNYSVEAVDDSGILARTLGSYSNFEGESVKAPYNAYVLVEGTLYQAAATNKEYNKSLTLTEDNMKVQVVYAPTTIENVVYYQEAEDVEGLTLATNTNTGIRSSNSASAYAAEADVVLTNLAAGKYTLTAVICDTKKAMDAKFSFIAGTDTVLTTASSAVNWSSSTSQEFTLAGETAISLAKGGNSMQAVDFVYIQKTGDVASRFDLTAYNDTVAWANEQKATLNAEDASEAEVIVAIDDYIASAAQWLAEVEADPEATQADVDFIAQDLKAQVTAVMGRVQLMKLWPEAEALLAEADSVYASYTDPTDEAGLVNALRSFPRSPMFVTSVEELQAAMDTLKAAMEAFIAENNNAVKVTKIAYLQTKGDKDDAIYDALVAAGYAVDSLNYADVTLSDAIIESELVGYDVVVLGGSTGSGANLAKTANLLLGKVNVLSTKAFWYKHYGVNGGNPGTADAPSLSLAKVAGYEAHPIYAGIEGNEFAVFNDMGKSTGRYLQSNGSFSNGPEQAAIGTTNGANCIGEAWVDGFGYIIIPVDGLQPSGYLTADGAQLFVNAVEYLIAGEQYAPNAIEGVEVEATQWPADIYDLSGRMIKKAATSLEGLEKGLYIVNGKKLLVK